MRTAHQRSWQSWCVAAVLVAAAAACGTGPEQDSIWPPSDFELTVEQVQVEAGSLRVVQRFRVRADGVVVFGASASSVVDAESHTALPVFERLSVYQLVPMSTRALARRIDRLGVTDLERTQGERGVPQPVGLVLTWRAFGKEQVITAKGRVSGPMAEILAVVAAHLPDGERFQLPGLAERPVVGVLRGVPAMSADPAGALAAHRDLLVRTPTDGTLLLDALALACHLGRREVAEQLLQQWTEATADQRRLQQAFPEGDAQLTPDILRRLLPPA